MAVDAPTGTVRGTLFVPPGRADPLPLVLVAHGYLASGRFMLVPWAADITALGAAALFIDRPGHGDSGGQLWPRPPPVEVRDPDELAPDLAAAISYARRLGPRIDPARVALLGHSDGGTAVLLAASADWDVRATVAISPAAAPYEVLNHIAPRDLLIIFGSGDWIVPPALRTLLIRAATRGHLDGPGRSGAHADASARELLIVPDHGHVSTLFAAGARAASLEWLRDSLSLSARVQLSSLRIGWIMLGLLTFQWLLWWPGRAAIDSRRSARARDGVAIIRSWIIPAGAWTGGLLLAPTLPAMSRWLPGQETASVAAVALGLSLLLAFGAVLLASLDRLAGSQVGCGDRSPSRGGLARAAAWSGVLLAGIHILCWNVAAPPTDHQRLALWGFFGLASMPLFWLLDRLLMATHATAVGRAAGLLACGLSLIVSAPLMAARMAVVPIYLLAATIGVQALAVAGGRSGSWGSLGRAAFGAIVFGRLIATTCPLY
jgi:dienelactone hydrolase